MKYASGMIWQFSSWTRVAIVDSESVFETLSINHFPSGLKIGFIVHRSAVASIWRFEPSRLLMKSSERPSLPNGSCCVKMYLSFGDRAAATFSEGKGWLAPV